MRSAQVSSRTPSIVVRRDLPLKQKPVLIDSAPAFFGFVETTIPLQQAIV